VDEIYGATIVRPLVNGSLFLWKIFDVIIIDGLINGLATLIGDISTGLRPAQTGKLRTYATVFLAGVIILIAVFVLR
jgi:NADH-quinone oxidoreductase subunit L